MRNLIIYLYQSYLLYRYEQQGIVYTVEYEKQTNQYYGSVLNLSNGVRIDISSNIKTNFLFRRLLLIEMEKEFKRNEKKNTHIQKVA